MSGDEFAVELGSLALSVFFWWKWYLSLIAIRGFGTSGRLRRPLAVLPPLCAIALYGVLKRLAAHDVRDDTVYLFFYMVLGAGWLGTGTWLLSVFGLSLRDDVCERGNAAAAWAIGGGMLGITAVFAGANIGDGPGWWCVAFAAGLAMAALFLGWYALDALAGANDSVIVDRDTASGIRAGAYLAASGLLLGRGAAGDWTSAARTVVEFASAWAFVPLTVAAVILEKRFRPSPARPVGSLYVHGVFPALLYLSIAVLGLSASGPAP